MYDQALMPATEDDFDRQIKGLFASGVALGRMERQDDDARRAATKIYRSTLGDLPADLLASGIKAAVSAWKFPGLPEPDAIRSHVSAEITRRKVERRRLQMALKRLPTPPALSDSPKREVSEMLAELRAGLAMPAPGHSTGAPVDAPARATHQPCRRGLPPLKDVMAKGDQA